MLLFLLACSLPPIDTADYYPQYEVTCDTVTCANADYYIESPYYSLIECTWDCIDYQDQTEVYLSIEFTKINDCYEVYEIRTSDGYCYNGW